MTGRTRIAALLTVCAVCAAPVFAQPDVAAVDWFTGGTVGTSWLTRTADMLIATVETSGLNPGDVYTLWWVIFNVPGECDGGCGADDFFNEDADVGIGNASGNVAKIDGTIEFGATTTEGEGEAVDGHQVARPAPSGSGEILTDAANAEVHFVVQTHGQARGGPPLLSQLSEVFAACTSTCADIQFAVHTP